ncbi:PadR family transcriptional regulator [Sporolactobacillus pectinivorans]|uniref:PadR family transcriptional regulator n=1 Tax=Sporolactobacillus pectinivorans TaxID=1591408 RepID=UPI000C2660FF|nr:PadR family transcriptional regulator [Sporolactobacillus pectinivorans]
MRENKSLYALLGILMFGPHTGYDIKQRIEQRLSHFWHESYGQIYPNLKRLVELGWATLTDELVSGRSRKIYTITKLGQIKFHEWMNQPLSPPSPEKNEMLLRLYFGQNQSIEENRQLIRNYREQMEEIRSVFHTIQNQLGVAEGEPAYGRMTLGFGMHVVEAITNWCLEQEIYLEKFNHGQ